MRNKECTVKIRRALPLMKYIYTHTNAHAYTCFYTLIPDPYLYMLLIKESNVFLFALFRKDLGACQLCYIIELAH